MEIRSEKLFDWWKKNHQEFRTVLFDVDGTLVSGCNNALPGSSEMIHWLRKNNFPFYLLTNDGNHSTEEKSFFINRAGLDITPDEIISCSMALYKYTADNQYKNHTFFVMGDLGNPCYAENAGLIVCRDVTKVDKCSGIIVGEGVYDWSKNINAVLNSLRRNHQRPLLVPNPDSYWPSGKNGEVGIGAGGKARFICSILEEMGIHVEPIYLGKPYPAIFNYTLFKTKERYKLATDIPCSQVLMIGDSLKSDILGAGKAGMRSALVLTGITPFEQVKNASENLQPEMVFESIL